MYDPFIGEVRLWPAVRIPHDWAACNGQLLPINGNQALYSLIGTRFGGNGTTNFALPDLRGRVVVGGTVYEVGNSGGAETVALTVNEMPAHSHAMACTSQTASQATPESGVLADVGTTNLYAQNNALMLNMAAVTSAGSGGGHNNMQPSIAMQYIICTAGTYPPRN